MGKGIQNADSGGFEPGSFCGPHPAAAEPDLQIAIDDHLQFRLKLGL
ncbi:MAG: hypothetical protein ACI8UO_000387 [Verrucomicrobiales bacterium]|jgi:hypothetical protein